MNPLLVFGRVPLFYFVVHFVLIRLLTIPLADFLVNPLPTAGGDSKLNPPAFGFGLAAVYGLWLLVVVLMYPLCLWFCRLKARRRDWWLSYI
jgi:hypothetical protein